MNKVVIINPLDPKFKTNKKTQTMQRKLSEILLLLLLLNLNTLIYKVIMRMS